MRFWNWRGGNWKEMVRGYAVDWLIMKLSVRIVKRIGGFLEFMVDMMVVDGGLWWWV